MLPPGGRAVRNIYIQKRGAAESIGNIFALLFYFLQTETACFY